VLLLLALVAATARADDELTAEQRRDAEKKVADLNEEAKRLQEAGAHDKAMALLREALQTNERLYPKSKYPDGHAAIADSLYRLGDQLRDHGDYAQAEPFFRDVVAMRRRLYPAKEYPDGHADLAKGINELADVLELRGQFPAAETLFREALDMRRRLYSPEKYPDGHNDLGQSLNDVGQILSRQGEYARAEPFYREALAMRRRLYPKDKYPDGHRALANNLNNLGLHLQDMGEYDKAEPFAREAVEMARRLFPPEKYPDGHRYLATIIGNLGLLLEARGEYDKAEPLLREALEMDRRLHPRDKYPDGHPILIPSLINVGSVLQRQGAYGKAEPLIREALDICHHAYPKDKYPDGHVYLGLILNNLGQLRTFQEDHAGGEALLREALEVWRRLLSPDKYPNGHPYLALTLVNLGSALQQRGDYVAAEPYLREGVAMQRRLFPPEKYADGHADLTFGLNTHSRLFAARQLYAEAERLAAESLAMHYRLALRYADTASEAEALNYLASLPRARDGYLGVTRHLPADPAAYDAVWESRAALTRLLERRHRDLLASRDDEARELGRQLAEARQRLAYALLHPARDPEEQRKEVQKRTDAKEDLERRLARRLRLAPPRTDPRPLTPRRLSDSLPEGAAFVDLLRYTDVEYDPRVPGHKGRKRTDRYVAFVLGRGRPAARVELKDAAPIEDAWAAWGKAITAARPDESAERQAAARFAELVWKPLAGALPAEARTLYLAAEGPLARVPWGALPGQKGDTVLLDECAICLVPHGPFLLQRLQEGAPTRSGDTLVAYGGVDYAGAPGAAARADDVRAPLLGQRRVVWPELPGTSREQEQVVALARGVLKDRPLARSGRSASTAQLVDDLPRARYAHLATHGFFADPQFRSALQVDPNLFDHTGYDRRGGARSPLVLSGLVLAGANRRGDEAAPDRGIITGEGLVGLPLEGLELAVLSACETGLGEDGGGEGAYGLQRAFHVAGCKAVVASLWKVDDGATQALMALFYRNLWAKKLDPAEALRQAQLALYRHPEAAQVARRRGADFSESDLPKVEEKPAEKPRRSPAAHWAAFTFSGVRPPEARSGR
jgi:CHAT domain-containing protein